MKILDDLLLTLRQGDIGKDIRCGPLVHARLGVAQENSGKLVAVVR